MVRVPSRGCTCLKCTNRARSAPPEIASVPSVEVTLQLRRQGYLRYYLSQPNFCVNL
nr:MAG TPA: hypothetical protein [Caudoviricetes sp.]